MNCPRCGNETEGDAYCGACTKRLTAQRSRTEAVQQRRRAVVEKWSVPPEVKQSRGARTAVGKQGTVAKFLNGQVIPSKVLKWGSVVVGVVVLVGLLALAGREGAKIREAEEAEAARVSSVISVGEARQQGLLSGDDEQRAALWRARDEHWVTLESLDGVLNRVYLDKVISLEEYRFVCTAVPQWVQHLEGVAAYVKLAARCGDGA